jgi:hypothetical protein
MGKTVREFNWRTARGFALALRAAVVCLAAGALVQGRTASRSGESGPSFTLLSLEEGRAIADVARGQEEPGRGAQDCSHLVHETYLRAGFDYHYASSFELYAGHESFVEVRNPQAGDLIVWPGHVGIVLDPGEHQFFSLVSTGAEAQDYEGPYWRSRGRPRFYRYKVEIGGVLRTAKTQESSRTSRSAKQQDSEVVTEERTPVRTSEPIRSAKMAAGRTKVVNEPAALPVANPKSITFDLPQSIVIAAGTKQPTSRQVSEGILELSNASGSVLRAADPSKLALPVVIFERLRVERLEIKRGHGWARIQLDTQATIAGGKADHKRGREQIRWELRRTESGWEAIMPADRMYVPNDVAVRNLAAQLAWLTEEDGAVAHPETVPRQEAQLANLLSALLENK